MENETKGAGDDYPIIPQTKGSEPVKTITVRILKSTSLQSWYRDKIGHTFEVYHDSEYDETKLVLVEDRFNNMTRRFVNTFDCEIEVDKLSKTNAKMFLDTLKENEKLMEELASLKEENAKLKECFELSEQAKNHLRTKGYGWTGLDILKTCELVPFSDNK